MTEDEALETFAEGLYKAACYASTGALPSRTARELAEAADRIGRDFDRVARVSDNANDLTGLLMRIAASQLNEYADKTPSAGALAGVRTDVDRAGTRAAPAYRGGRGN
jgi:hypothetical protein